MISISIPIGNYNVTSLVSTLNSSLASYNFSVIYLPITNKLTFTNTNTFTFDASSSILPIIGFYNLIGNLVATTNSPYSLTSNAVVNLQTQQCVNICSNFCTSCKFY